MTYGCKNAPRPTAETSHPAQDGWYPSDSGKSRVARIVPIKHAMTTECQYTKTTIDAQCIGCIHHKPASTIGQTQ